MEDNLSHTLAERPHSSSGKHRKGRWKTYLLATVVPAGLLFVFWFVFRDQLIPAVPVETARVTLMEQTGTQEAPRTNSRELMFQASGWVEPESWPTIVPAKVNGFVERVFFREGESVTNGQLLATLDATDAQLELGLAEARVSEQVALLAARTNAVSVALKKAEAASFRVDAAMARLAGERDTFERFTSTSPQAVSQAERVAAEQTMIEFDAEEKAARAALASLEGMVKQAEFDVGIAEAMYAATVKQHGIARLALERTQIRSEMEGVVLRRYVNPGDKRVVQGDDLHSTAIASLYNPRQLQVRVDVPIAEAGKMQLGQPAYIVSALLPDQTFTGRVSRIIGQADLQRNTLQAKVQIINPDARLRPEVLCRVEFFSMESDSHDNVRSSGSHALWIPVNALDFDKLEQVVWVVDPLTRTVEPREIKLYQIEREGYRMVASGLRANERVVVGNNKHALDAGRRVKEIGK